jgi:DNA-binding MarR family transcriptional regulator
LYLTRSPTDEELALAEAVFGMFALFKNVTLDAAHTCAVGSPERARILWSLKAGPVRAGGLASVARLSPPAITETVEGLERDGLVRREADPEDRRAVRVALTADGRRQLQRFETGCASALADRLAPLSAAQRQRIRAAFDDLREVIVSKPFTEPSRPEASLRGTRAHKEAAHVR